MFKSDFTLLVEMEVAVSTCNAENPVLIVVGNRCNISFFFHLNFLSSSQLDIKVVKLDFFAESLENYNRICTVTVNGTFDFCIMIGLINDLLCYIEPVIFLGLNPSDLLSDGFFSFLAIASFDGVSRDRVNNILHELSPVHHTVTIDIDLCEKFVTTVD